MSDGFVNFNFVNTAAGNLQGPGISSLIGLTALAAAPIALVPKRGVFPTQAPPNTDLGPSFTGQVTIEEVHHDEMEIVEHPIEQGAAITDHAYKRPAEVTLRYAWSTSPAAGAGIFGLPAFDSSAVQNELQDIYAGLLALQDNRVLCDIFTGKRVYSSMLLKSLAVTTDKHSENALFVTCTFKQVILVNTQTVTVPASAANQAQPQATQASQNVGSQSLQSGSNFSSTLA